MLQMGLCTACMAGVQLLNAGIAGVLAAVSQRWTFDSQMRVVSNNPSLCLAADSCTANNCPVRLATCGSNDNQRWLVDSKQRLRPLNGATVCMELPSSAATAGTAVRLWSVATSSFTHQQWSITGECGCMETP
jgi:hypothetical protein